MPETPRSSLAATESAELVKGLGLFDSTMIVCGSMIGSGIFIVSADIAHQVQSPALLLIVWLITGAYDPDRRAQLRRTRRRDAQSRRPIRLPPRIARPAVGFPLRLDHAAGHSDRHHRRRRHRFRQIYRRPHSLVQRRELDLEARHRWSLAILVRCSRPLQRRPQPPEPARHSFHRAAHLDQYSRPAHWQSGSKYFHRGQSRLARRPGADRLLVLHPDRPPNQFHRFLAQRRPLGDASVSRR